MAHSSPNATARPVPVAMTIAGSDSSGGAGIQADLATFHALGVHGTSAITCLTCQNFRSVTQIIPTPPEAVAEQIRVVCRDLPVAAVKTGMLFSAPIVEAVASTLAELGISRVVVDPVMRATSGAMLLEPDAERALVEKLLPRSMLVTPNGPEAEHLLGGGALNSLAELCRAARSLAERFGTAVLVKGGHLAERGVSSQVVDVLATRDDLMEFTRCSCSVEAHGSGCTLSAAIAAHLARGCDLVAAVQHGIDFVARAFQNPVAIGPYRALNRFPGA